MLLCVVATAAAAVVAAVLLGTVVGCNGSFVFVFLHIILPYSTRALLRAGIKKIHSLVEGAKMSTTYPSKSVNMQFFSILATQFCIYS